MARRSSGERIAINVVKAIVRANKQAAREAERNRKAQIREAARSERERERRERERERQRIAAEKKKVAELKAKRKADLAAEKSLYESRVEERKELRLKYVAMELK